MPKFRTLQQNNRFWAIVNKLNLDRESLDEIVSKYSNGRTTHSSKLYVSEMEALNNDYDKLLNGDTKPSRKVVYQRSKTNNVEEFLTSWQRDKIRNLCTAGNINDARLAGISKKACKKEFPLTKKQGQQVIEALKGILGRESKKLTEAA